MLVTLAFALQVMDRRGNQTFPQRGLVEWYFYCTGSSTTALINKTSFAANEPVLSTRKYFFTAKESQKSRLDKFLISYDKIQAPSKSIKMHLSSLIFTHIIKGATSPFVYFEKIG